MKDPTNPNPTPDDDGIDRRGFLECMTWAGTGVIWMLSGGLPRSVGLASAEAASALTSDGLTFLQISDSHVGFDKPANPDALSPLREAVAKIKAMPAKARQAVFYDPHR